MRRSKATSLNGSSWGNKGFIWPSLQGRDRPHFASTSSGFPFSTTYVASSAALLGISEITVKAHRGQMMRKMKADSLADLATMTAKLRPAPAPQG
jgi:hypothetical protein